jgi:hypothetical protein
MLSNLHLLVWFGLAISVLKFAYDGMICTTSPTKRCVLEFAYGLQHISRLCVINSLLVGVARLFDGASCCTQCNSAFLIANNGSLIAIA